MGTINKWLSAKTGDVNDISQQIFSGDSDIKILQNSKYFEIDITNKQSYAFTVNKMTYNSNLKPLPSIYQNVSLYKLFTLYSNAKFVYKIISLTMSMTYIWVNNT